MIIDGNIRRQQDLQPTSKPLLISTDAVSTLLSKPKPSNAYLPPTAPALLASKDSVSKLLSQTRPSNAYVHATPSPVVTDMTNPFSIQKPPKPDFQTPKIPLVVSNIPNAVPPSRPTPPNISNVINQQPCDGNSRNTNTNTNINSNRMILPAIHFEPDQNKEVNVEINNKINVEIVNPLQQRIDRLTKSLFERNQNHRLLINSKFTRPLSVANARLYEPYTWERYGPNLYKLHVTCKYHDMCGWSRRTPKHERLSDHTLECPGIKSDINFPRWKGLLTYFFLKCSRFKFQFCHYIADALFYKAQQRLKKETLENSKIDKFGKYEQQARQRDLILTGCKINNLQINTNSYNNNNHGVTRHLNNDSYNNNSGTTKSISNLDQI